MSAFATVMQVVAWALWFQREAEESEWEEPHDGGPGRWSFDEDRWRRVLLDVAHVPPKPGDACTCGVYRQLCAWCPPGPRYSLSGWGEWMKHLFPAEAVEMAAETGCSPLYAAAVLSGRSRK